MSTESNALAPVAPHNPPHLPAALAQLSGQSPTAWSSLNLSDPRERRLYIKAALSPDVEIGPEGAGPLNLHNVYADECELADKETGELDTVFRIVLIDDMGKTYQTFSEYARKSLAVLINAYGKPPFNPPIRVRVEARKSANKRTFYQIVPIFDAIPSSTNK